MGTQHCAACSMQRRNRRAQLYYTAHIIRIKSLKQEHDPEERLVSTITLPGAYLLYVHQFQPMMSMQGERSGLSRPQDIVSNPLSRNAASHHPLHGSQTSPIAHLCQILPQVWYDRRASPRHPLTVVQKMFLKGERKVTLAAILRQSRKGHSRKNIRQRILAGAREFCLRFPICGLSLLPTARKVTGFGGTDLVDGGYRTNGE